MGVDARVLSRIAVCCGAGVFLAACTPGGRPNDPTMTPVAVVEPSYVFALGAHQADVVAMLGKPARGPRFDRYSQTNELVYSFPYPIIQAESVFPNRATRNEMVKDIHMFFDRNQILTQMAYNTNHYYPSITNMPVHRITVLPRVVEKLGFPTAPGAAEDNKPKAPAPAAPGGRPLPLTANGAPPPEAVAGGGR